MNHSEIKCKIITPTFIYGANKDVIELRESSIKGVMRYWWRAITSWDDTQQMHKSESELFGDSVGIKGKSPIRLKIEINKLFTNRYHLLRHKEKVYMKSYIPGSIFTINLYSRENIEIYNNIVIATILLGGFGKRSRRGFGSSIIDSVNNEKLKIENLCQFITKLLNNICGNKVYEVIDNNVILSKKSNTNYPTIKKIEIGKKYRDFDSFLKKIGDLSHRYKSDALGYIGQKGRLASPIVVSAYQNNQDLIPIITTLSSNISFKERDLDSQNAFKEGVL